MCCRIEYNQTCWEWSNPDQNRGIPRLFVKSWDANRFAVPGEKRFRSTRVQTNTSRVAIYCRVSTIDQTTLNQEIELREYASRRGWVAPAVFKDTISRLSDTRPALDNLLQSCRAGLVDTVVVVRLDRLGGSLVHLVNLISEFLRLRVNLVCVAQGIDTSNENPFARFQIQMLGVLAEYELALNVERVRAGHHRARKQGKRLGRVPLDTALRPRAAALRSEGKTLRQIASELGVSLASAHKLTRAAA